jgi:hypothetical protein
MPYISAALRQRVADAARHRCGYCLTVQKISGALMHIEHIIPLALGGASDETNLWLACAWCNSYKATQIRAVDPQTGNKSPCLTLAPNPGLNTSSGAMTEAKSSASHPRGERP